MCCGVNGGTPALPPPSSCASAARKPDNLSPPPPVTPGDASPPPGPLRLGSAAREALPGHSTAAARPLTTRGGMAALHCTLHSFVRLAASNCCSPIPPPSPFLMGGIGNALSFYQSKNTREYRQQRFHFVLPVPKLKHLPHIWMSQFNHIQKFRFMCLPRKVQCRKECPWGLNETQQTFCIPNLKPPFINPPRANQPKSALSSPLVNEMKEVETLSCSHSLQCFSLRFLCDQPSSKNAIFDKFFQKMTICGAVLCVNLGSDFDQQIFEL